MSQENVEVVQRMYEALHGGDAEGALAHFDADVTVDASSRIDGEIGSGREALARIISNWLGAFEPWCEEIEEVSDRGDRVHVVATQHGRGREADSRPITGTRARCEVQGGKITRMTLHAAPAEALEA